MNKTNTITVFHLQVEHCNCVCFIIYWSGREDSNLRPPAPHADALSQAALRPDINYFMSSLTRRDIKALRRPAVFLCITPLTTALSITL